MRRDIVCGLIQWNGWERIDEDEERVWVRACGCEGMVFFLF